MGLLNRPDQENWLVCYRVAYTVVYCFKSLIQFFNGETTMHEGK